MIFHQTGKQPSSGTFNSVGGGNNNHNFGGGGIGLSMNISGNSISGIGASGGVGVGVSSATGMEKTRNGQSTAPTPRTPWILHSNSIKNAVRSNSIVWIFGAVPLVLTAFL